MSNCKYCGKPAGFLSSKHAECEKNYQTGKQKIGSETSRALNGSVNFDTLEDTIVEIEKTCFVPRTDTKVLLINAWESAVDQFLNDGILDKDEDDRLIELQKRFYLSQDELNNKGAFTLVGKASILRDILNGELPQRKVLIDGPLAPNIQKGEQLIWAFPGSKYSEDKTKREFVGGSQGMSVRIMKGVYYNVGAFKGHAVEQTKLVDIDTGCVAITNKNIYFTGPQKSIRIPFKKIVTFQPFSDGIGVILDNATAKRLVFITGDGWFTYNLVTNLSGM